MNLTTDQLHRVALLKKAGINIALLEDGRILVEQTSSSNGYLLTQKQLSDRAKAIFPECHTVAKVMYIELDGITPEWIKENMKRIGIYQRDLSRQIGINETSISLYLNGKRTMTKAVQALFYYYFAFYDLNANLRSIIKAKEDIIETLEGGLSI